MNKRQAFLEKYTCVGKKIDADIVYGEQARIYGQLVDIWDGMHKLQIRLGKLEIENSALRERDKIK